MKERLWGKVVRRVAQLQAKGYQSTCSNTRKFMCNLLLRKSDGKKARFIIIIKNRCIFGCNDFLRRIRIFGQFPLFLSNDSAFFVANYPTIMQRKIYVGENLQRFIKFQMLCIFERLPIFRLLRQQV